METFRHQRYGKSSNTDVQFVTAQQGPQPGELEFSQSLEEAGRLLRQAGVAAIYLIHGTFVGNDAFGLIRRFSRLIPNLGRKLGPTLRRWHKRAVDTVLDDVANYSEEFRALLEEKLSLPDAPLPVRLFHWGSENNHLARADAAIRLIDALRDETTTARQTAGRRNRILLWGHSHGGNVLALLTNLLAADHETRRTFFHLTRNYYQRPWGTVDLPVWKNVETWLDQEQPLVADLDIVTFGTPVRYGWAQAGDGKLLHVIHHRPRPGHPPDRAVFPFRREDLMTARDGDYLQQLGIAGTDFSPGVFSWRARKANRRLSQLLEQGVDRKQVYYHLLKGQRVPDQGRTLLVDYGPPADGPWHLAGHGLYTMIEWMHFHVGMVVDTFYS